ncbi:C1 family peptidase [Pseudorhodobacter sp.]|uniref:C1 family peptidase n=1 Tax=Pseudorhodobacter sp. TaxID=1934400 RepID=UPI0026472F66|nr:C1 family peptidase [Pseudorhodobacter sp.]MDN5788348.1 C1 family peptidase [Pseudorhodobacter sp.]
MTLETAGFGAGLPASVREYLNAGYFQAMRAKRDDKSLVIQDGPIPFSQTVDPNWTVKDQGSRPTCTAFAAVAMMEQYWRPDQGLRESLSEQFLYYQMRHTHLAEIDPAPKHDFGATRLSHAREVIETMGLCATSQMKYMKKLVTGIDGPAPNASAVTEAENRRHTRFDYDDFREEKDRIHGLAILLHGLLKQGRPVAISLATFLTKYNVSNWKSGPAEQRGIVYCPLDKAVDGTEMQETATDGHTVCLVGFEADPSEPLGGWFIFRNSWNSYFAKNPTTAGTVPLVPAVGYGALSASHLESCVWEFLSPK